MIARPYNDRECLSQLLDDARAMRNSDVAENLAAEFSSPVEVAQWIRNLPQLDDDGADPESIQCDTRQRLRNWPGDPNCFERTAMFVAVADRVQPDEEWSAATVETRNGGRHTVPLLLGGAKPIVIDVNPRRRQRVAGADDARNGADDYPDNPPRDAVVSSRTTLSETEGFYMFTDINGEGRWAFFTGPYQAPQFVQVAGDFGGFGAEPAAPAYRFLPYLRWLAEREGIAFFGRPGTEWEQYEVTQRGQLVPRRNGFDLFSTATRNADPWVQDFFEIQHTAGGVVFGLFGAGAATEKLGDLEIKEGLRRDPRKTTPAKSPTTKQQTPTEDDQWPKDERSATAAGGSRAGWGLL